MKKKGVVILCAAVAAAAAVGLLCWRFLGNRNGGKGDNVVYVNTVEKLMSLGSGNGMMNRFAGVVESQETWSVQQNQEKTVKEILVSVGQEVTAGTPLFTYDTEKFQSDLSQAQLDLERINNEISSMNSAIADLEKEKKKADANSQATYTLQIQEQQLQVRQKEFDAQSKQLEIDKLIENINNATVTSEIDGVVKSINNDNSAVSYGNGDNSFMTIMKTGDLRIKGTINEQNMGSLIEGSQVIVHSRVNDEATWKGTVTKIDRENTVNNQNNMYYGGSSDASANSSSYPFYVDLETSEGLMMGQHVYLEMDYGQSEVKEKEGVWLDSYLIDMTGEEPFVWADNGKGRLEKRKVTLGDMDEVLGQYEITEGLAKEDAITWPEEGLEEGMETTISKDGMMGQSNPEPADGEDTDGGATDDGAVIGGEDGTSGGEVIGGEDGMSGGEDMPAEGGAAAGDGGDEQPGSGEMEDAK